MTTGPEPGHRLMELLARAKAVGQPLVLLGIGNEFRGDDAIGHLLAQGLQELVAIFKVDETMMTDRPESQSVRSDRQRMLGTGNRQAKAPAGASPGLLWGRARVKTPAPEPARHRDDDGFGTE